MARFLVATVPVVGHINPLIPIARTLVERGHAVRWCTGAEFRAKVEATGATFALMSDAGIFSEPDAGPLVDRLALTGLRQMKYDMKHLFTDQVPDQIADLRRHLSEFPADIMVSDSLCLGPLFLSELEGPPCAICGMSVLGLRSRDTAPMGMVLPPSASGLGRLRNGVLNFISEHVVMHDVTAYANGVRAGLGLGPLPCSFFDMFLHLPALYMQPTAPSFEYPRSDLPDHIRFIGPLLPDQPTDFVQPAWWGDLDGERSVVLVTQGTVATEFAQLTRPTLEGLADENLLVIATTGGVPVEELRANAPANARIEEFISFHHLLPHVDVMVTNAGYGGVQFALTHGVPMVVAGRTEEKPEICARIGWSGVGIDLKTHRPTPKQIRQAVKAVLTDSNFRNNAERIRSDMAQFDGPNGAADLLEGLVGR